MPSRLLACLAIACLGGSALLLAGCGDETPTPPRVEHPDPSPEASPEGTPTPGSMLDGPPEEGSDLGPVPEGTAPSVAAVKSVPDTLEAFDARMQQLVKACTGDDAQAAEADARDLLLPNTEAWFAEVYGKDHERLDALIAEYDGRASIVTSLPAYIRAQFKDGLKETQTERFIDAQDDLATGFQSLALRHMKAGTALYSLRLMKADDDGGWHLYSFAHVDGQFRLVGEMMALSAGAANRTLRQLSGLRIREALKVQAGWAREAAAEAAAKAAAEAEK